MKTILLSAILTLAINQVAQAIHVYDVKTYGSCSVASVAALRYDGHMLHCPSDIRLTPNLTINFRKEEGDKTTIEVVLVTRKIPKQWGPKDPVSVTYRFDLGDRLGSTNWKGEFIDASMRSFPEGVEDSFRASIDYPTGEKHIAYFLAQMKSAKFLLFAIEDINNQETIVFSPETPEAVEDFLERGMPPSS